MLEWVSKVWCNAAHRRAMWPMAGHYLCAQCLRAYPVCWEMPSVAAHLGPIPRGRLALRPVGRNPRNFGGDPCTGYLQPARLRPEGR